jgi:hypothetical protein
MLTCFRIWTGEDQNSHFEEGCFELTGELTDLMSPSLLCTSTAFRETYLEGSSNWHTDPVRQLVITLSGSLEFVSRTGESFVLRPGNILLAEETTGTGHSWKLIGSDPWRRVYIVLDQNVTVPFKSLKTLSAQ